jgi:hypothetical protein
VSRRNTKSFGTNQLYLHNMAAVVSQLPRIPQSHPLPFSNSRRIFPAPTFSPTFTQLSYNTSTTFPQCPRNPCTTVSQPTYLITLLRPSYHLRTTLPPLYSPSTTLPTTPYLTNTHPPHRSQPPKPGTRPANLSSRRKKTLLTPVLPSPKSAASYPSTP